METDNAKEHTIKATDNVSVYVDQDFHIKASGVSGLALNGKKIEIDGDMLPDIINGLQAKITDLAGKVAELNARTDTKADISVVDAMAVGRNSYDKHK